MYDATGGDGFVANDDWWGCTPTVSRLDLLFFDTCANRGAALESGQVDGIAEAAASDLDVLNTAEFSVVSATANSRRQIWMRTDAGLFEVVRVRQAFALRIDRQALMDTPHVFLDRTFTTGGVSNSSNHADAEYDELPVVVPYFLDLVFTHRSDLSGVASTPLAPPRLANAQQI
jgi:ABC-type oligopeptide transport system substrate-binding subunit